MTDKEIINKLDELSIIKKGLIDKSNFEQAAVIGEDERILRNQLKDLEEGKENQPAE